MSCNDNIKIGAQVTVGEIKSASPQWSLHVKPGNRKSGATGSVTGFYRMDFELIAVAHIDGSHGVYEVEELTSRS